MNGAQWLVQTLQDRGVDRVFVLCGNGLDPFLDACLGAGVSLVDVRNEQAAAYMADTWGRMTGGIGVAAVSSGPGHTNALTGLANAAWDGGPMLLISGCSSLSTRGLDHFQELDQVGMAAPVCKHACLVSHINLLQREVDMALSTAVASRPGPVHLTIPVDVFESELNESTLARQSREPVRVRPIGLGDPGQIGKAVEMLAQAQRPLMIVGSGAFYADAWENVAAFASLTDMPILSHIWDRGCVEQAIPQYVGVTNDELNGAMSVVGQADLFLVVGARIDYRLGYGRPPTISPQAKFVRLDADPLEVNRGLVPDVAVVGDPSTVLAQMTASIRAAESVSYRGWLGEVCAARDRLLNEWQERCMADTCPVPGLRICREIKPFLDRDVTFLLDGGNIGRWAHMVLFDRHPAHLFTCGASGVVGWGLPGAVAAKMARPDHPLLLLSGDGAAGFTVTEIETALRFGTPYVAVVAHDGAWGIVADGQPEGRCAASKLGEIRFDRIAQALGAQGVYIEDPAQLGPAIAKGLQTDRVTVIQVPTQQAGIGRWMECFGQED